MSELLRMEHISKRFGNFYANQDINFSVAKGEVHKMCIRDRLSAERNAGSCVHAAAV